MSSRPADVTGQAASPGNDVPPALAGSLQHALDDWAGQEGHMGVSATVILPDGKEWQGTAGIAAEGQPLEPGQLTAVASITKSATGAVIMQLAEEGVLGLDDRIDRWLEPLANVDPAITLRQLLNHTSGVANFTSHARHWPEVTADFSRVFTPQETIERWVGPPIFAPGERTQYTNTAFVLLGMVAEAATGRPVAELYRERLWEPLGLEEIFLPSAEPERGDVATSWVGSTPAALQAIDPLDWVAAYSTRYSAFGLVASARNVARWCRALFTGDVLTPQMRAQMLTLVPSAGVIPVETGVGLGVRHYEFLDREQWGHSGAAPEGSSLVIFDPETQITVAVLMNQGGGAHRASHFRLTPHLLEIASGR